MYCWLDRVSLTDGMFLSGLSSLNLPLTPPTSWKGYPFDARVTDIVPH